MVSIGDNSRSSGAHFFSGDLTANDDYDALCEHETISIGLQQPFPRLRTISTTIFIFLILILCEVLTFVIPQLCHDSSPCIVDSWSSLVCLQAGTWILLLLVDQVFRCHYHRIRQYGYLNFYRETRNLKRSALFLFSIGNALMLVIVVILQKFCDGNGMCFHSLHFQNINYLQLLITAEVVISLLIAICYLVKLIRFSTSTPVPDVNLDDLLATYPQFHAPRKGVGYRDEADIDVVIEQQADVIQYLKQHNVTLGKKIIQLNQKLNSQPSVQ